MIADFTQPLILAPIVKIVGQLGRNILAPEIIAQHHRIQNALAETDLPGSIIDEAVIGMAIDEKKNVTIPVDKAYGPRNEELVMTVPKEQVPPDLNPEVGQKLQMQGPDNTPVVVEVTEVAEEHIKLDANPPLAGKDLIFDLELVEIAA